MSFSQSNFSQSNRVLSSQGQPRTALPCWAGRAHSTTCVHENENVRTQQCLKMRDTKNKPCVSHPPKLDSAEGCRSNDDHSAVAAATCGTRKTKKKVAAVAGPATTTDSWLRSFTYLSSSFTGSPALVITAVERRAARTEVGAANCRPPPLDLNDSRSDVSTARGRAEPAAGEEWERECDDDDDGAGRTKQEAAKRCASSISTCRGCRVAVRSVRGVGRLRLTGEK